VTTGVVLRRELRALVALPHTYAIAAAFLVLSGIFFVTFLLASGLPDLERYYSNIASTLIVLAPMVAMRAFAEERRSGALDITLTWPLPRSALVTGKYLANLAFTWLLLSVAWLYVRLLVGLGDVEVGKAAGGFVGILLLAAAFNALALAVSARASSPTAAAFLGFALLLGLWVLQYTRGHILGGWLADLAPAAHLEAAGRGVLDAGDALYFLTCVVLGLGLAVVALDRQRAGSPRRMRRRLHLGMATVGLAGVSLSMLGPAVAAQVDLTPTKRFTVTDQTRAIAAGLRSPVQITGFVDPDSERAVQLRALASQYRVAGIPVRLEVVDPDTHPSRARAAGVTRYGQLLVATGGRTEIVDDVGQVPLTSAISRLTHRPARACFTVGHGEPDLNDENPGGFRALGESLRQLGVDTVALALGAPGAQTRLDRCDVVVAAPRIPLLAAEVDRLRSFTAARGRLLVLSSPDETAQSQLNDVLRPWGLTLGPGAVQDRSALADDPASVVALAYPSESPPTRALKRDGIPTLWVRPQPVELAISLPEEASVNSLVASSSYSRRDGGTHGPFSLAALADWSGVTHGPAGEATIVRTRIGVLGSAEVATNRFLETFGNRNLVTGLIQWIARDDDIISAGRAFGGVNKVLITGEQRRHLVRSAVVLPSLAALVPLPVALLRLRRG
jgi:ABC-type transport system involved in cytochrome c biogenesis permease component